MINIPKEVNTINFTQLPQSIRNIARRRLGGIELDGKEAMPTREGEIVITTYDRVAATGIERVTNYLGCTTEIRATHLVLTLAEFNALSNIAIQSFSQGTVLTTTHCNMHRRKLDLWDISKGYKTRQAEAQALHFMAVPMVLRYTMGHTVANDGWWCEGNCGTPDLYRTRINLRGGLPAPVSESVLIEDEVGSTPMDFTAPQEEEIWAETDAGNQPSPPGLSPPEILPEQLCATGSVHGAETANIVAKCDDFMVATSHVSPDVNVGTVSLIGVVGREHGNPAVVDNTHIVGALLGPISRKPNVYSDTHHNVEAAIKGRIVDKRKTPKPTKADILLVKRVVKTAMGCTMDTVKRPPNDSTELKRAIFAPRKIHDWAVEHLTGLMTDGENIRSSKWTKTRYQNAVRQLMDRLEVKYDLQTMVKAEQMPEGKAPRLIVNDGDLGQIMALPVIACFEHLLFAHMEERSVKHADKRAAIERCVNTLTSHTGELSADTTAVLVEGDGSAWDTTCSKTVRDCVENPILRHIMYHLNKYFEMPAEFLRAHDKINSMEELRLKHKDKPQGVLRVDAVQTYVIDAIRRSGHRGTSCLNYWVNLVLWICSVFDVSKDTQEGPEVFLDPDKQYGVNKIGQRQYWNGVIEGDDSLCVVDPPMSAQMKKAFESFWDRWGFNMKLKYVTDVATFCGYSISCTNGYPNRKCHAPEVSRMFAKGGLSCTGEGKQIFRALSGLSDPNPKKLETLKTRVDNLRHAVYIGKAYQTAGVLPTISRKFLEFAISSGSVSTAHSEELYRHSGVNHESVTSVVSKIEELNSDADGRDELSRLEAVGCPTTLDELERFAMNVWSSDPNIIRDIEAFAESLPKSWR